MRAPAPLAALLALATLAGCGHRARPATPVAPLPAASPLPGTVVDKVVAIVLNRPITLSECELEVRIDRARTGDVATVTAPVSDMEKAAMLTTLVDRAAVIRALRSHYQGTLDGAISEKELKRVRARFASESAWRAFLDKVELSDEEVEERIRRALEAQAILVAKLTDLVRVGRKEVDDYLAAHPGATREGAETAVAFESANLQKPGIIADARRATGARIVDPIVAPREGAGTALGTTRDDGGH